MPTAACRNGLSVAWVVPLEGCWRQERGPHKLGATGTEGADHTGAVQEEWLPEDRLGTGTACRDGCDPYIAALHDPGPHNSAAVLGYSGEHTKT